MLTPPASPREADNNSADSTNGADLIADATNGQNFERGCEAAIEQLQYNGQDEDTSRPLRPLRGVLQRRVLPPVSPLLEGDNIDYPLPAEIPPLSPASAAAAKPHIFHRIMQDGLLAHCFMTHLEIDDLVNLYSICLPVQAHCKASWSFMARGWAQRNCPINWACARFRYFSPLCITDPAETRMDSDTNTVREVPGFRYLRMIHFRENCIQRIVRDLAQHGHRLPSMVKVVLAKLWFAMDVPRNQPRANLFASKTSWTNANLFVAMMFFIKLEMRLTDPRTGGRSSRLRNLWMAQRGFGQLDKFLRREIITREGDLVLELAKWKIPKALRSGAGNFLGVPMAELGKLGVEKWQPMGNPMLSDLVPVDEWVLRECIKREMQMSRYYLSIVTWGYVGKDGQNVDNFLGEEEDEEDIDEIMATVNPHMDSSRSDISDGYRI